MFLKVREETFESKQLVQMSFLKKKVCQSVCPTFFFESADARDVGLVTLFFTDDLFFHLF